MPTKTRFGYQNQNPKNGEEGGGAVEVNKEVQLAEGWLNRQMEIVRRNVAEWPAYLKRAAGIADVPETAREAWDESNRLEEFLTEHIHVFELLSDEQITPRKAIESLACYRAGNVPALPESSRLEHGQGAQAGKFWEQLDRVIATPPEQPQGSGEPNTLPGLPDDIRLVKQSAGLADRGEGLELDKNELDRAAKLRMVAQQGRADRDLAKKLGVDVDEMRKTGLSAQPADAAQGHPEMCKCPYAEDQSVEWHPIGSKGCKGAAQPQMSAREWLFANGWAENEGCWWHAKTDPFGTKEIDLPTVLEAFARSRGEEKKND